MCVDVCRVSINPQCGVSCHDLPHILFFIWPCLVQNEPYACMKMNNFGEYRYPRILRQPMHFRDFYNLLYTDVINHWSWNRTLAILMGNNDRDIWLRFKWSHNVSISFLKHRWNTRYRVVFCSPKLVSDPIHSIITTQPNYSRFFTGLANWGTTFPGMFRARSGEFCIGYASKLWRRLWYSNPH